jgi:A/G-specific adenine glycosylase
MNQLSDQQIVNFQNLILTWWQKNRRDLPWRKTHDPYHIHVSEVMLQQTQVSRALPKFHEFLKTFPTVKDLAKSKTGDVIIAWKGMGYNRRALYLKKTAEVITSEYDGIYPPEEQKLLKLPGLGLYTTRAILVFAYNQQMAFVDTNIKQIIEHYFFEGQKQTLKDIQSVADQLVPKQKAWDWHQALMDYGSLELKKVNKSSNNVILNSIQDFNRITKAEHKTTNQKIPFQDTNRFIRGKIMDMVREQEWNQTDLIKQMEHTYAKPQEKILYNLNKLILEGLLEKDQTTIKLPK